MNTYELSLAHTKVFSHYEDDVSGLLVAATEWIKENDHTLLSIAYGNSLDGEFYEYITVTVEEA